MDSLFTFNSQQMKAALSSLKQHPLEPHCPSKTTLSNSQTTNSSDVRVSASRSLGTPQPPRKLSLRRKVTFDVRASAAISEVHE